MTKVYISSTYQDLVRYRERVADSLRKMDLNVVAMELYVATDQRPVEKCLADVAECDIYIGIFAFRYGYIPTEKNPQQQSITELEYRHAVELGKIRLIFLVKEDAPWPRTQMDPPSERIDELRSELQSTHTVSFFTDEKELATLVVEAVHLALPRIPQPETPTTRQPRQIRYQCLVLYSHLDETFAQQMAAQLAKAEISLKLSSQDLFAEGPQEFEDLERRVHKCLTAVVVLSDAALNQIEEASARTQRIFKILRDRTGKLIAVCLTENLKRVVPWGFDQVINVKAWSKEAAEIPLDSRLQIAQALRSPLRLTTVGLPFVVVAMTAAEAAAILDDPNVIASALPDSYTQFCDLRKALENVSTPVPLVNRYGQSRESWKPFLGSDRTVNQVIGEIVTHLNRYPAQLRNRVIKAQYYSFDELVAEQSDLLHVYEQIAQVGCIVLLDEFSMFHPVLRSAFQSSALAGTNQAALVTLSPFEPYSMVPNRGMEGELKQMLMYAFRRFADMYDARYEFSVGDEQRLKRWLHSSLPQTLIGLQDLRPNQPRLDEFKKGVRGSGSDNPAGGGESVGNFMYTSSF